MNITRHNYEEFFILYLDNELGSDERRQVETFVSENPDLKNEFDLLLQTRMTPDDDLVFDGKQELLKTASPGPINETNFEEWLLLYIDNELTSAEKIAVEEFLASHPSAGTTLQQFEKTKLHPEQSVVFPNKEILYRREKRTPVIAFRLWKIAVAASLLLAISTTAFLVFKDDNSKQEEIISQQVPGTNSIKDDSAGNQPSNTGLAEPVTTKTNEAPAEVVDPSGNELADQQKDFVAANEKSRQRIIPPAKQNENAIANKSTKQKTNNLPDPAHNPKMARNVEENPIAMVDLSNKEALTSISDNKPIEVVTPNNDQSLQDVESAVSKEPYDLADADEPGKKNKFRGFFRKVTRTFEKRTNIKATDEEDRLLLAGLSIKL